MYCQICGTAIEEGMSVCPRCAGSVRSSQSEAAPRTTPAAQQEVTETVVGTILYASAYSHSMWSIDEHHSDIYALFFTDTRMLAVHSSKLRLPGIIPYAPMSGHEWKKLNRAQQQAVFVMRTNVWARLRKGVGNNSVVNLTREAIPQELHKSAEVVIPYVDIKHIKFRTFSVNMIIIERNSGQTFQWSLISPQEEVRGFLNGTPLASKLK